ncbi:hypothetical protein VIGAN_08282700, partial [Vigna angularis var. angularis]
MNNPLSPSQDTHTTQRKYSLQCYIYNETFPNHSHAHANPSLSFLLFLVITKPIFPLLSHHITNSSSSFIFQLRNTNPMQLHFLLFTTMGPALPKLFLNLSISLTSFTCYSPSSTLTNFRF